MYRRCWHFYALAMLLLYAMAAPGQDLLNDDLDFSGLTLELVEYVRLPESHRSILSMSSPPHDDRLFVSSASGGIYAVDEQVDGSNVPTLWFDAGAAAASASGRAMNFDVSVHGGLRSFALHPDFATNGKLYVSLMQDRPLVPSQFNYLGQSVSEVGADGVVAEFTYDHEFGQFVEDSYRELFRVNMPVYDHPLRQIKFNQFSNPGDEDYGLLYITHGDASLHPAPTGGGQNRDDALGKIIRVDPLVVGELSYTTPNSPFLDDPDTLAEIYALGFRNPHNLSFAKAGEQSKLIVADIGRDNMEEVNIVEAGANHGWSKREGTFVHLSAGGYLDGVVELPDDDATNGYTYPVAQFDHNSEDGKTFSGIAIAGGHVIANGSELDGEYIFGEFASSGHLYHASFDDMLGAVTTLDPGDPARDEPSELTQANISRFRLQFDHDKDPDTPAQEFETFTEMLGERRSDMRFGEGARGELYISSKRDGRVYLVTNSLPSLFGDLNNDDDVDAQDIDLLWSSINAGGVDLKFDLTNNGSVDVDDVDFLVGDLLNSKPGDVNLDGKVEFGDFLVLSGKFGGNGGWALGDFNGDGQIAFADFLQLSANFDSALQGTQTVPEPHGNGIWLLLIFCSGVARWSPPRVSC